MTDRDSASAPADDQDEFYIGYEASMPPRTARFVSIAVIVAGCGVAALAVLVAAGHTRLQGGVFEFGHPQSFSGTIVERPYPALRLDGREERDSSLLLVAPGKHGADALVAGLDGQHVSLMGTRILRSGRTMLEVEPASIAASATKAEHERPAAASAGASGELSTLTGEVVDSKCFMGVMVPGDGKTHADCAALCLRGGIPPALYVRDRSDRSALVLLAGSRNEAIGPRLSEFAGEAVEVTGILERTGEWPVVRVESMRRK